MAPQIEQPRDSHRADVPFVSPRLQRSSAPGRRDGENAARLSQVMDFLKELNESTEAERAEERER